MNFNNTKIIHSALFLVSILLASCGGGGNSSPTGGTQGGPTTGGAAGGLMKLTAGNSWSYNVFNTVIVPPPINTYINNGTKTRVMGADGITLTDRETLTTGSPTVTTYSFTVAANGDVYMANTPYQTTPALYLPANPALNVTWSGNFLGTPTTMTVTSTTVTVTVPAGTFTNCTQVDITYSGGNVTWIFSHTVGNYVKNVYTMTNGSTHIEELTAYTAN